MPAIALPGEVWRVDLGLAAKVRPALILSDYPADDVDEKNDKAMDAALSGILEVVKDNPLKDFETFRSSRAKGEILEI